MYSSIFVPSSRQAATPLLCHCAPAKTPSPMQGASWWKKNKVGWWIYCVDVLKATFYCWEVVFLKQNLSAGYLASIPRSLLSTGRFDHCLCNVSCIKHDSLLLVAVCAFHRWDEWTCFKGLAPLLLFRTPSLSKNWMPGRRQSGRQEWAPASRLELVFLTEKKALVATKDANIFIRTKAWHGKACKASRSVPDAPDACNGGLQCKTLIEVAIGYSVAVSSLIQSSPKQLSQFSKQGQQRGVLARKMPQTDTHTHSHKSSQICTNLMNYIKRDIRGWHIHTDKLLRYSFKQDGSKSN